MCSRLCYFACLRWSNSVVHVFTCMVFLGACSSSGGVSPAESSARSTLVANAEPTTSVSISEELERVLDPFVEDDRFPCGTTTTADMRACNRFYLNAAQAQLHVQLAWLDNLDLMKQQALWSSEVTDTCEMSHTEGSIAPQIWTACLTSATESRAHLLTFFDLGDDYPDPLSMWGQPVSAFELMCETKVVGEVQSPPFGDSVLAEHESSLVLEAEIFGAVVGTLESRAVLVVDGSEVEIDGVTSMWGQHDTSTSVGVWRDESTFGGEININWGYWWMRWSDEGVIGELVNLFDSDSVSAISGLAQDC